MKAFMTGQDRSLSAACLRRRGYLPPDVSGLERLSTLYERAVGLQRIEGPSADVQSEYAFGFAGLPPMVEVTIRPLISQNNVPQAQPHFDRFF